jgi:uncharacterized protein YndB with AHSA1/START domain
MSTTHVKRRVNAPREAVYRALLDRESIARWKVPDGMRSTVHELDAREGGKLRVSLTYDAPDRTGKTVANTDTYHGRFVRLVPNELIVEADEFETDDPALRGEMTSTIRLTDSNGGTEIEATHEGLPPGVAAADNEMGWRMSLDKLAGLVERAQ